MARARPLGQLGLRPGYVGPGLQKTLRPGFPGVVADGFPGVVAGGVGKNGQPSTARSVPLHLERKR
jgi:hypothetical protein